MLCYTIQFVGPVGFSPQKFSCNPTKTTSSTDYGADQNMIDMHIFV